MAQSERHQRFIEAVNSLKLRFPGREIAEKTGYNKATVSAYIKEREPSENFIKTFAEHFGLDYAEIWFGKPPQPEAAEPTAMQLLAGLTKGFEAIADTMRSIESKMAQQADQLAIKEKVQDMEPRTKNIESNLNDAGEKLATLERRQDLMIREFREQFLILTSDKKTPSGGVRKKVDRKDGNP